MTAKHRKGKSSNHRHEDNFLKHDSPEAEVPRGGSHYTLLFILFLMVVIGGVTAAWFCFQQHQTISYLAESVMGMQGKIMKLQSSLEEIRQSQKPFPEGLQNRLDNLEESYALAQKQVGIALATAEQLKTTDLPSQVLSLHTEMKSRLAEVQQDTVSMEQLSQLQAMLQDKTEEFESTGRQLEGLAALNIELSMKVETLTENLGQAESKLEDKAELLATLSATLDDQAAELSGFKEQLATYGEQLETSTLEMATVRKLLETELVQQANMEEHLSRPGGDTQPFPQTEEDIKEEEEEVAAVEEDEEKVAVMDAITLEQEDSVTNEGSAPAEEVGHGAVVVEEEMDQVMEEQSEQEDLAVPPRKEAAGEKWQAEEVVEVKEGEDETPGGEEMTDELPAEEDMDKGGEAVEESPLEEDDHKVVEEEVSEKEEELIEEESNGKEELKVSEEEEEQNEEYEEEEEYQSFYEE
ncbi:FK506-binding protein 5 [Lampris incognitus]|uniref:FK506-binding protein 5 n=1 Tax=Lampris incognitus TaxID=2546036 RepID=UPI0024B5821A|nr:FK506-binding protein 5 [Lampris incognitus]